MPRSNVMLPPLIIDGEPKILHSMTVRDLQMFIPMMLKAVYRVPLHASRFDFQDHPKPPWWPTDLPWSSSFWQYLSRKHSGKEEHAWFLRHLITTCYVHYNCEHVLYLFDVHPGEHTTRWSLEETPDHMWRLLHTQTKTHVWTFPNSFQIVPLLALQAKCEGTHNPHNPRKRQSHTDTRSSRSVRLTTRSPERANVHTTAQKQRRPSFSIMGSFSPRRSDDAQGGSADVKTEICIPCSFCDKPFRSRESALEHEISCAAPTRAQAEKAHFLYQFGLVSKIVVNHDLERDQLSAPMITKLDDGVLCKAELSSPLGQRLLRAHGALTRSDVPATTSQFAEISLKPTKEDAVDSLVTNLVTFPIVYRPSRWIRHYHTLKFTREQQRRFAESMHRELLARKFGMRLKSICRPCSATIPRLSCADLQRWLGPSSDRVDTFAGTLPVRRTLLGHRRKKGKQDMCDCSACAPELRSTATKSMQKYHQANLTNNRGKSSAKLLKGSKNDSRGKTIVRKKVSVNVQPRKRLQSGDRVKPTLKKHKKPSSGPSTSPQLPRTNHSSPMFSASFPMPFSLASRVESLSKQRRVPRILKKSKSGPSAQDSLSSVPKTTIPVPIMPRLAIGSAYKVVVTPANSQSLPTTKSPASAVGQNTELAVQTIKLGGVPRMNVQVKPISIVKPMPQLLHRGRTVSLVPAVGHMRISEDPEALPVSLSAGERRMVVLSRPPGIVSQAASSAVTCTNNLVYASTVFKCHVCGVEQLFKENAWTNIEFHMSLNHFGESVMYHQHRQEFSRDNKPYCVLIVEAFLGGGQRAVVASEPRAGPSVSKS